MKFKYPLKGEVKLCVCMILIYYTCIINLRWYDTLEILLYEKYYTVNGEKKVHKDEKKCNNPFKWNICTTKCKYLEKMSTKCFESDDHWTSLLLIWDYFNLNCHTSMSE